MESKQSEHSGSISSKRHGNIDPDEEMSHKLPSCWMIASDTFGAPLQDLLNTLNRRSSSPRSYDYIVRLREALIGDEELRRMFDYRLTKTMGIENLLMEEKIKNLSRYVLKDSFDLGLNRYYSHIAHHVNSSLRSKGIQLEENPKLIEEKEKWLKRKLELNRQKN
jgi:hypothetical protein